ncbi:MAG: acetate--CoA ligase family protein, partial [Syntrophales bacterium]|nr:acetate--CoA ligase family protein [Syntrophales bacterium]
MHDKKILLLKNPFYALVISVNSDIRFLFEPRNVAIIGASRSRGKIGYNLVRNILSGGFRGKVFPVNPAGGTLQGIKMFKTIEDIEEEIDLACICIPAPKVFNAIQSCARKKVKFVAIITSGFSEIGNTKEEEKIVSFAKDHGMGILGPNIFGLYSAASSLNCTFGFEHITPGSVGIITQSGAIGLAISGKAASENMGLSAMVSIGNKADIDEADLLEYLIYQDQTKVVLMYIEGIKNGEKFIQKVKRATLIKPIIVIKSGRSKKGAIAAASHTGSLAGSDEVFNCITRQCGILRAESIKDAFSWCNFFSHNPLPKGENTLIVTNGGGIGVLAADACEKYGVHLYDNPKVLREAFSTIVPPYGSTKNPIDLTAEAKSKDYDAAFEKGKSLEEIHAIIGLYCETAVFDKENLADMILSNVTQTRSAGKPMTFALLGGESTARDISTLKRRGIAVYDDAYEAVAPLGAMFSYCRHRGDPPGTDDIKEIDVKAIENLCFDANKRKGSLLLPVESREIMNIVGIDIPQSFVARNIEEAVKYADLIGYPVVLKVISRDIIHKSDVGGVALDLQNAQEVINGYEAIMRNCLYIEPQAIIEGIEVTKMVRQGIEMIVGARRDKIFGPIVMCGLGGIYVETIRDISFRSFPANKKEIIRMIRELKSYPLLLGVRGEKTKDIDTLVAVSYTHL